MRPHRELRDVHISLFDESRRPLAHELIQPAVWQGRCCRALSSYHMTGFSHVRSSVTASKLCNAYLWPL
jgi:hypothetical protein